MHAACARDGKPQPVVDQHRCGQQRKVRPLTVQPDDIKHTAPHQQHGIARAGRARRCQIIHQQKRRKEAKQKRQAAENHGPYPPEPSTNLQKQKISHEKGSINFGICVHFPTKKTAQTFCPLIWWFSWVVLHGQKCTAKKCRKKQSLRRCAFQRRRCFSFLNIRWAGMSACQLRSTSSGTRTCVPATSGELFEQVLLRELLFLLATNVEDDVAPRSS